MANLAADRTVTATGLSAQGAKTGFARIGAPRPTLSRVTMMTAGLLARGSSLKGRLPGTSAPVAVWVFDSPLTVAGAAAALRDVALTAFPIDPLREPSLTISNKCDFQVKPIRRTGVAPAPFSNAVMQKRHRARDARRLDD